MMYYSALEKPSKVQCRSKKTLLRLRHAIPPLPLTENLFRETDLQGFQNYSRD